MKSSWRFPSLVLLAVFPFVGWRAHSLASERTVEMLGGAMGASVSTTQQQEGTGAQGSAKASDFASRCHSSGVIRCIGFDLPDDISGHEGQSSGLEADGIEVKPVIDSAVKASGGGSLKFTIPSRGSAGSSGSFFANFSEVLSAQFGPGEEFYVQWRQRFSLEFIKNNYQSEGWKQIIVGEGDRPGGVKRYACSHMEIVVQNYNMRGHPEMYHSCGDKDGKYDDLFVQKGGEVVVQNGVGCTYPDFHSCISYKPNQWMTFQLHVKIGTWYANDKKYHRDSTVQLWVAEEGKSSVLAIDFRPEVGTGYDLVNSGEGVDPSAKYGKLYLLPYQTGRSLLQAVPVAYTWYDELIISRSRIPDPKR
jgi:hypothetical protein